MKTSWKQFEGTDFTPAIATSIDIDTTQLIDNDNTMLQISNRSNVRPISAPPPASSMGFSLGGSKVR
jgi:hypothetical protein